MEMSQLTKDLLTLKQGEHRIIYTNDKDIKVTVTHTGKLSSHDFGVGLIYPKEQEFRPTHIRLLIDLHIKKISDEAGAHKLFLTLEKINNGEDPLKIKGEVKEIKFPMQLDDPETNLYYTQLLMIEQDINYAPGTGKQSKLNPPHEYLMRFIRWVASGDATIDRIIFAAAGRRYPAPEKYSKPIN